jgi:hypothetical protein
MYLRLGMSESSLLLLYFIEKYTSGYNSKLLIQNRKHILNWLFSTSGYFDTEVKGRLFDFDKEYDKIINTKTYNTYFEELLHFIKNNEFKEFYFKCHDLGVFCKCIPIFYKYINKNQSLYDIRSILYKELDNKRVLLMHNLSDLMVERYNKGIIKKIYPEFPNIDIIIPFKIGYTFMNTPMNDCSNIIDRAELIEYVMNEFIETHKINMVIISCGAYSNIFARKLHKKHIQYITVGGELEHEFGIIINRHDKHPEINEYFIRVPDELKPENHHEIENSCYW